MERHWTDRLSEYLDGELPDGTREKLEAHLADCPECRAVLDQLREVAESAHRLEDRMPERDLWPEIARGIGGEEMGGADVIDFAHRSGVRAPGPRGRKDGIRLTLPQLTAASLVLTLVSGAAAWFLRPVTVADVPVAEAAQEPLVNRASELVPQVARYTHVLAELEDLLQERRNEIAPSTILVVERNLTVIDRAISESLRALEADPENRYLEGHVTRAYQRKVALLRGAASLVTPST
jgi:hypothetical protein